MLFRSPKLQIAHKSSYVYGNVVEADTDKPLKASVSLIDLNTNEASQVVHSDSVTGNYLIVLTEGSDYGLFAEKQGYLYKSENFSLDKKLLNPVIVNFKLERVKVGSSVVLNNIFFAFDSYSLTPQSKTELNKVLSFLNANKSIKIEIAGYTDNLGSEKYNMVLSRNRAKAVYDYLVEGGVPKAKLSFKGYGASNFLNSNDSEEGRIKNRRIEFKISK